MTLRGPSIVAQGQSILVHRTHRGEPNDDKSHGHGGTSARRGSTGDNTGSLRSALSFSHAQRDTTGNPSTMDTHDFDTLKASFTSEFTECQVPDVGTNNTDTYYNDNEGVQDMLQQLSALIGLPMPTNTTRSQGTHASLGATTHTLPTCLIEGSNKLDVVNRDNSSFFPRLLLGVH